MSALGTSLANLREAPRRFAATMFRGGAPTTDRTRSTFVFGNVFLHLHPVRTHRWSLRWATTWGLGTAAFAAFLITLVTGVLLMFYYKPYPDVAYASIKDLHYFVPTGRFIRIIHRWAAQVMVAVVILHMARVFFTSAYRAPREYNWVIGMGLLVVTLGLSFTGYLPRSLTSATSGCSAWLARLSRADVPQSRRDAPLSAHGLAGVVDDGRSRRSLR